MVRITIAGDPSECRYVFLGEGAHQARGHSGVQSAFDHEPAPLRPPRIV
jgi:hypothetical protein